MNLNLFFNVRFLLPRGSSCVPSRGWGGGTNWNHLRNISYIYLFLQFIYIYIYFVFIIYILFILTYWFIKMGMKLLIYHVYIYIYWISDFIPKSLKLTPQTSETLGVLAALVEDQIPYPGPRSVPGNWPLWFPVVPREPPAASR